MNHTQRLNQANGDLTGEEIPMMWIAMYIQASYKIGHALSLGMFNGVVRYLDGDDEVQEWIDSSVKCHQYDSLSKAWTHNQTVYIL